MRIEIEIPKEFEEHFNQDKFKDSLERIMADIKHSLENRDCLCAGRYEYETIEMLQKAFENSRQAYPVDKVADELKELKAYAVYEDINADTKWLDKAIEIVKQGGVLTNNRKDCEYRHDNGNCLKVGGFCTSVDDKHCEKMNQGGVSDDVCEWKQTSTARYKTRCGYKLEEYFDTKACYCKQCGKKIKVVE